MTHEETLAKLCGFSFCHSPNEQLDGLRPISGFEIEKPRFLWQPYIPEGQLTILDARGGTGKTSLLLALSAAITCGRFPMSDTDSDLFAQNAPEPAHVLYFGTEDSGGSLKGVYEACGGNQERFYVGDLWQMDALGLEKLNRQLEALPSGPKLVILDPIAQFLPATVKTDFDKVPIRKAIADFRGILRANHTSAIGVRHMSVATAGKGIDQYGSGGEIWRDCSRSQLVMLPNPSEQGGTVAVFHTKGMLGVKPGPPFGFHNRDGVLTFVKPENLDLDPWADLIDPKLSKLAKRGTRGERGPVAEKLKSVMRWMIEYIKESPEGRVAYHTLMDEAGKTGAGRTTIFEARKTLGLVYCDMSKTLSLPDQLPEWYDPFADEEDT